MTTREVSYIVKDQTPLMLAPTDTIQAACRRMSERRAGSVLVVDEHANLVGIFTGRDSVKALAGGKDACATTLAEAMTSDPVTIAPDRSAIDALHAMCDGGFRHLPVVDHGRILGVVSRGDFKGFEIDRLDQEEHLWECVR